MAGHQGRHVGHPGRHCLCNVGVSRYCGEKEEFEFYVNNYPNKKRKKRVIGTKTLDEQQEEHEAEIDKIATQGLQSPAAA